MPNVSNHTVVVVNVRKLIWRCMHAAGIIGVSGWLPVKFVSIKTGIRLAAVDRRAVDILEIVPNSTILLCQVSVPAVMIDITSDPPWATVENKFK